MGERDGAATRRGTTPLGTRQRHGALAAPSGVERPFTAVTPTTTWVSDTTGVWSAEGWLDVAGILDRFSRVVVGWAMRASTTEAVVRSALKMALARRSPPKERLVHADQGNPSTTPDALARRAEMDVEVRSSPLGACYAPAGLERFFSTLKDACGDRHPVPRHAQARHTMVEETACFSTRLPRHSPLKERRPTAAEELMRSVFPFLPPKETIRKAQ